MNTTSKHNKVELIIHYRGEAFTGVYVRGENIMTLTGWAFADMQEWFLGGVQGRKKNIVKNTLLWKSGTAQGALEGCYPMKTLYGWYLVFDKVRYEKH